MPNPSPKSDRDRPRSSTVAEVVEVLTKEANAIVAVATRVNNSVTAAVDTLEACEGRVIVTGMGKMGCIARKASATFCSTGTPSVFLHPTEAVHGDLGIVNEHDVALVLSNSGESREIIELLPFLIRLGIPIIGLTGNLKSSLASRCDTTIDVGVVSEADTISVAPTCSTTVTLAMCDALAVALMSRRGFTKEQFAIFHPKGHLGGKLLIKVSDLMTTKDSTPKIQLGDSTLEDAVRVISQKGKGAVFVVSDSNEVVGIVTDGDLRRTIERAGTGAKWNVWGEPLSNHMTANPKSISSDSLAAEALKLMEENGITILPVVDANHHLIGAIHLHDLIKAGLA